MKKILIVLAAIAIVCSGTDAQARKCGCKKRVVIPCKDAEDDCCDQPVFHPDPNMNSEELYAYCGDNGCREHTGNCKYKSYGKQTARDIMIMHYKPEGVIRYKICKDEDGKPVCCRY